MASGRGHAKAASEDAAFVVEEGGRPDEEPA
jgi:hypothetical protein